MKKVTLRIQFLIAVVLQTIVPNTLFAQDVIVMNDGSTTLSKVLEVNINDVKYKKFSNIDGPTYVIPKSDIMAINYENGEKDYFKTDHNSSSSVNEDSSKPQLIEVPSDTRNSELISLYSQLYKPKDKKNNKDAKTGCTILGVSRNSKMSNNDIEINFVLTKYEESYFYYNIKVINKTSKPIYIDKRNCFRVAMDGTSKCYYDATKQISVNKGGESGASIGLGSLAGALGIGGAIGQAVSGVSVGGATNSSITTTHTQQRFIAIPPYGSSNLSEEIRYYKFHHFRADEEYYIDEAERIRRYLPLEMVLKRGMVKCGEYVEYSEELSPWKCNFYITYSKDQSFDTYSILNVGLYLHELIGDNGEGFDGENKYTLFDFFPLKKE